MPSNKVPGLPGFKGVRDVRDHQMKKNPNLNLFNPHPYSGRAQPSEPDAAKNRVHFISSAENCDSHQRRPQSAPVNSSSNGYRQGKPDLGRKRPQSAMNSKEKEQVTKEKESLLVDMLGAQVAKLHLVPKKERKKVWHSKKTGSGIIQLFPLSVKEEPGKVEEDEEDRPEKEVKKKHRLAQFHWYKYPKHFHHYGKMNNNNNSSQCIYTAVPRRKKTPTKCPFDSSCHIIRRGDIMSHELCRSPPGSKEIPNCLQVANHGYRLSAVRQSCCYKPFGSVTRVNDHHMVRSVASPHPVWKVNTSTHITRKDDVHNHLADDVEDGLPSDNDQDDEDVGNPDNYDLADDVQDDLADDDKDDASVGNPDNNGSFFMKHNYDA